MKSIALVLTTMLLMTTAVLAADAPLKVVMFSGSSEYDSKDSLQAFKKLLEEKYNCACTVNIVEEKGTVLNGIEGLDTADVAVFFTRRVSLAPDQLERIRKFIASGRGVVGIRTASHGFQTWLEFDPQVLGGSYGGHYNKDEPAEITIDPKGKDHPVLAGVEPFSTQAKLYKNPKIADDATVLLRGRTASYAEPVAWAREAKPGVRGRVFYTSLGAAKDFEDVHFQRLLTNAVIWASGKKVEERK
jgi:type 1 glutamine amidotransferase